LDESATSPGDKDVVGKAPKTRDFIYQLYATALGREPTQNESATASELLGQPLAAEGVEDLLWIIAMLPEFQLAY
jgi:hypothetical protein